ncbi:PREDICTED: DNA-directed RNA polymerase III subunit RPC7-like [Polistes dominula]|uniref:DNA-directed RNA polymerase III subunit RPC7-like n=1 Tax=Polistes dominula TaxID=743375 RepID=A0ABM1HUG2_POLDO|nr:PREDICTED: DNA-directed RNA polymerase III subunit RPC7-like [Polistes dominula]
MAGRGHGKGSMSFTFEQLGLTKAEAMMHKSLEPPPKYPILEYKPLPFTITNEMSYLLELKRDFAEYLKESSFNVRPIEVKKDVERYSDRFQDLMTDKSSYETKYDWSKIPEELKPSSIRRKKALAATVPKKKQKVVDVESKLQELEKKEINQQGEVLESEEEKVEEEEEEEKEVGVDGDEVDEEMDEGTDYVNSYFDNGEGYDDEEDNMDDGAIY